MPTLEPLFRRSCHRSLWYTGTMSVVGGSNPEGGGETPNAPKTPCFCGREVPILGNGTRVGLLLCCGTLLLMARQSGGFAEGDV